MAAPKIKTIIKLSINSKIFHYSVSIIENTLLLNEFVKEGEEITYEQNEQLKSLTDIINRNGNDVLN